MSAHPLQELNDSIVRCNRCPRLRNHCTEVGQRKRAAYAECEYWQRPVPNFGDNGAEVLIVGLAPAAHGANRTGRMFTGDRSGQWLYRALHKAGFANQPDATGLDDGLRLKDCLITAVCHCAPPVNKPDRTEIANCREWLDRTLDLTKPKVLIALGQIAWNCVLACAIERKWWCGPRPRFGHSACVELAEGRWLLGSYHPSQQNTFTGRLTEPMFDAVFSRARELAGRIPRCE